MLHLCIGCHRIDDIKIPDTPVSTEDVSYIMVVAFDLFLRTGEMFKLTRSMVSFVGEDNAIVVALPDTKTSQRKVQRKKCREKCQRNRWEQNSSFRNSNN